MSQSELGYSEEPERAYRYTSLLITSLILVHGGAAAALIAGVSDYALNNGTKNINADITRSILFFCFGILAAFISCLAFAGRSLVIYFYQMFFPRTYTQKKGTIEYRVGNMTGVAYTNLFLSIIFFPIAVLLAHAGLKEPVLSPPALGAAQTHSAEDQRPLEGADARSLHPFEEGPVSQEPVVDPVDVEPVVDDSGPGVEATGGSEPPERAGDAGKVRLKAPVRRLRSSHTLDLSGKSRRPQQ